MRKTLLALSVLILCEISLLSQKSCPAKASCSCKYQNLFEEIGFSTSQIDTKVKDAIGLYL